MAENLLQFQSDPDYLDLVRRRRVLAWTLTSTAFGLLVVFIAVMSWAPGLFARTVAAKGFISIGMIAGLVLISACLVMTFYYLRKCDKDFEPMQRKLWDRLKRG